MGRIVTASRQNISNQILEHRWTGFKPVSEYFEGDIQCIRLTWIMHEAESATQNRPLNFELAAFFCAWKKAIQTSAIKNIK